MFTRAFSTSISVSENAQKNLGESTQLIDRTRLMQTMQHLYPGADGMTYKNAPTYNGLIVLRWYKSVMSKLDTRTGPWTGSAS